VHIYGIFSLKFSNNEKILRQICTETQDAHFMIKAFSENRTAYDTIGENMVQTDRQTTDDNTILRMHIAFWITKATDIHSEYIILIASLRQQRLRERASVLRLYRLVFL
jgi:cytidylate kinase